MSQAMNSRDDWLSAITGAKYRVFSKLMDINPMGPSKAYVFIDEHPDSINYGDFAVAMNDGAPPSAIMIDRRSGQLPQWRRRHQLCRRSRRNTQMARPPDDRADHR